MKPDPGSFRDPSGRVYSRDGHIYRTVSAAAAEEFDAVRATGIIEELEREGLVVGTDEADAGKLGLDIESGGRVLEHERIPFVSYYYEWPFSALKAAALLHLRMHLRALSKGVTLKDATAYNVQFKGSQPVFIDLLSFTPYIEGHIWEGHRQFCEQFLNPLLLRALLGVPHNAWCRGSMEGIDSGELSRLLPLRRKFNPKILMHVTLLSRLQTLGAGDRDATLETMSMPPVLPREKLVRMLEKLESWIEGLSPADTGKTVWADYENDNIYDSEERAAKHEFIAKTVTEQRPSLVWDIGCNTGEFSETALKAGAEYGIGFDFDQNALDSAFTRSSKKELALLPLFLDAANPSPNQGWNEQERSGYNGRICADCVLGLALVHHLAIGKNIPLRAVVHWLMATAPLGVVEFVPKNDSMVKQMLALREDIFPDYTAENFEAYIKEKGEILGKQQTSKSGRCLYLYKRR
ncbi:class I SAM-dependent methyltransferase [Pelagibius sp. Alg239-R121]|uniref:class I SAM-dependent methyltransferase n=1 Tax=Pelagibius sp. Alg239-R121 TaxID=2993448 RepID=UPI0024A61E55|nr:class I SAM-dependent methyltransferase [Pelagibius sp. Alg239-R121]